MKFFYTNESGAVVGPVTREQLQEFYDSGLLPDSTQACYEDSEEWQPVSQFVRSTKKPRPMPTPSKPTASIKSLSTATLSASIPSHSTFMTRTQGSFVIALLCIGLGFPFWGFLRPMPRFEYMVAAPIDTSFETNMNALGKEGWDIVTARRATSGVEYLPANYEVILKSRVR